MDERNGEEMDCKQAIAGLNARMMTSPTKEEVAQREGEARQRLIDAAKNALQVFGTDDYRVSVRGMWNFELTIKVAGVTEPLVTRSDDLTEAEARRLVKLVQQDCSRAEFGDSSFNDWSLTPAAKLIEQVRRERTP